MTSKTEPKEKYLPDERDNSPVDNWLDAMIDGKLDSAVYKVVHGSDSLNIDINSDKFRDECFKEAPWAESFYDIELGYVPEHGDQQHFYDIVEAMDDFTNS